MHDPVLRFKKSPSPDTTQYRVEWTKNGVAGGIGVIPRSASAAGSNDTHGYTRKWSADNAGNPVLDGDAVVVNLFAVDNTGNDSVPAVVTLDVPQVPPESPADVTLSLV